MPLLTILKLSKNKMPSFEECLHIILEEIQLSPEDRQSFAQDAQIMRDHLMMKMKQTSPQFKEAFDGLSLTGSYLDKLKIDLPDEFDMDMKLKLPFNLIPFADAQRQGFVILKADTRDHSFIGRKGKLRRYPLQIWLRSLFLKTITGNGFYLPVNNNRTYFITYPKCGRGQGVAHTVIAQDIYDTKRQIAFDFVPVFEFPPEAWPFKRVKFQDKDLSWFAIPFGKTVRESQERSNKYTFKISAPHLERAALHDRQNLKNSLRLMKALRDANDLEKLSSYTLKSVYLHEQNYRPDKFWEQPMGDILIEMLKCLLDNVHKGKLPFFLHKGFNQLNSLPKKLFRTYETIIGEILQKLKEFRDSDDVELAEMWSIFRER